jgi:PAS domain S-box-containing protein
VVTDITERKEAEMLLRKERDFNMTLVQTSPAFFMAIDTFGRTIMMNESMLNAVGWRQDEVGGKNYIETFVPPKDREMMQTVFSRFLENTTKAPISAESHVLTRDGRNLTVEWRGRPILNSDGKVKYVFGVGIDVTERKKAENELRARTELLEVVLSNMSDCVMIMNADYITEYMNEAAKKKFGNRVGRRCSMAAPGGRCQEDICQVKQLLHDNVPTPLSFSRRTEDGHELEVISNRITHPDGSKAVLSVSRDVTERNQLQAQLAQAQKMQTLGTLAGGVAHEFNNLHCGILGYMNVILNREKLSPSLRDKMERVQTAATRASEVTKNLLTFSRKQKQKKEAARLDEIVAQSLRWSEAQLQVAGVTLAQKLAANELCMMDKGQMEEVVVNLIINAMHAMADRKQKLLTVETSLDEHRATLKISDTGTGLDSRELPRIFEPFYTTKGSFPAKKNTQGIVGTGLGLSVCYGIVKDHGGNIYVESEKGAGTTFTVTLPRLEENTSQTRTAGPKTRVALLGTDLAAQDMIIKILNAEGYAAQGYTDFARGLAAIAQSPPDAVIAEKDMAGRGGEALKRALSSHPEGSRTAVLIRKKGGRRTAGSKGFNPTELLEWLYAIKEKRAKGRTRKAAAKTAKKSAKPKKRKAAKKKVAKAATAKSKKRKAK